ncbi:MAG: ABC transporter substrate-binding protein [Firmicutes bacterium]|nr:ABC transporter substrate-binding protein [Bacillota bacterium]
MKKVLKLVCLALAAVMLIGTLAACRNNEGMQGVTADTITVGNAASTSGPLAFVGVPFNAGILAYFDMVNRAGGIHGRTIEFVHHDDGGDPVLGMAHIESLMHDDSVYAIVGHFGTGTIGATLDMLKEEGIPVVYFASGWSGLFNDSAHTIAEGRNLFPVQPIFIAEGRVLVARAVEEYRATNIGVIFTNDDAGQDMMQGITYQANALGVNVVSESVSPGQVDVSSAVLRMVQADVDVVIAATIQVTLPTIINAIVASGLDIPVFTSYVSADAATLAGFTADYLGAGATFPIYATAWLDIGVYPNFTPDTLNFVAGMTDFGNPELADNAFAMAGWIAGATFVSGLRNMDGDDWSWDAFFDAMESAPIHLPMGPIMDFSNGARTGTDALQLLRADIAGSEWVTVRPMELLSSIVQRIQR